MVVTIELFGMQRINAGTGSITMPITDNTMVRDAIEYVQSMFPALHIEEHSVVVTVNREVVTHDSPLRSKDIIRFLTHIGGG